MGRTRVSAALASVGVIFWIVATLMPADWHPAAVFIAGVALLAASHWLTPCQDQITRWWRHRVLKQ